MHHTSRQVSSLGNLEDKVRKDIYTKFGSIPKMASSIGMAQTTIYHALDRGIENTTSKTKQKILEALYSDEQEPVSTLLLDEEIELIRLYRSLPPLGKHAVLSGLRDYVEQKG